MLPLLPALILLILGGQPGLETIERQLPQTLVAKSGAGGSGKSDYSRSQKELILASLLACKSPGGEMAGAIAKLIELAQMDWVEPDRAQLDPPPVVEADSRWSSPPQPVKALPDILAASLRPRDGPLVG